MLIFYCLANDIIFHCLVNDISTRTESWIMSSFKYHSPTYFFPKLHLFTCFALSSVQDIDNFSWCSRHSYADLFPDHYVKFLLRNNVISMWFWIYCKKSPWYISPQWLEFVLAVRKMSTKSQGISLRHPRGNPDYVGFYSHQLSLIWSTAIANKNKLK